MQRCILALAFILASGPAIAGTGVNTLVVTTTADGLDAFDQQCSLREALYNANANEQFSPIAGECPAGSATLTDVIVLASGQTYELTDLGLLGRADLEILNQLGFAPGVPVLRIETAGGATPATIRQQVNGHRVIDVWQDAVVELENLVIRGGNTPGNGGGIRNDRGHLTLHGVTVMSNSAMLGGGIFNVGTLLMHDSEVLLNSALHGGGLNNQNPGVMQIGVSRIRQNTGSVGGGIYSNGGTLTIQGSVVSLNNASDGGGGGLMNVGDSGSSSIHDSEFSSNHSHLSGGGIYSYSLTDLPLVIQDSRFDANTTSFGEGGAMYFHSAPSGSLLVTGTRFENNQSGGGGAVSVRKGTFQHCHFENNSAQNKGGAILADANMLSHLHVEDTHFTGNHATTGGGIWSDIAMTLERNVFSGNEASDGDGGAVSMAGNGLVLVAHAHFDGNVAHANGRGGAIFHQSNQSIQLHGSAFSDNEARLGGAVFVFGDSPLSISNGEFLGNQAVTYGGAVYANFMTVKDSRFMENRTSIAGGAILVHAAGAAEVSGSTFLLNEASVGGAIHALSLHLIDSELRENTAEFWGGAVVLHGPGSIDTSRFIDNSVTGNNGSGGGLYLLDTYNTGTATTITRSLFTGNQASNGGGVYLNANVEIGNSTIHANSANNGGGMFIHEEGEVLALNMTLSGHLAGQDLHKMGKLTMGNSVIYTPGQPDCTTTLDDPPIHSLGHNIVEDASCFFHPMLPSDQLIANPLLDELADHGGNTLSMALLPGSPLLDAGDNALCAHPLVNGLDQRQASRPFGNACDIGAHEQGATPFLIFRDGFEAD